MPPCCYILVTRSWMFPARTLALGWTSTDVPPVIVVFPPDPWRGWSRSSQMVQRPRIHEARWFGWSTYQNRHGTRYEIFRPFLLPVYVELLVSGQPIDAEGIRAAIGSELLADPERSDPAANPSGVYSRGPVFDVFRPGATRLLRPVRGVWPELRLGDGGSHLPCGGSGLSR